MKDATGQELAIGDIVVFATYGYTTLLIGQVVKFTPKGVKVQYIKDRYYGSTATALVVELAKPNEAVSKVLDTNTEEVLAFRGERARCVLEGF
jgi:hypothetical protein